MSQKHPRSFDVRREYLCSPKTHACVGTKNRIVFVSLFVQNLERIDRH
jgi:hypothetical protein